MIPLWYILCNTIKLIPISLKPNFLWNLGDSETSYKNFNGLIRALPILPLEYFKHRDYTINYIIQSVRQIKNQYPTVKTIGLGALNKNITFSNNGIDFIPFLIIWVLVLLLEIQ